MSKDLPIISTKSNAKTTAAAIGPQDKMTQPTRPLIVAVDAHGKPVAKSQLSSKPIKIAGEVRLPPKKIVPVIVVPGIMGSNLCAGPRGAQNKSSMKPGEEAWRVPNGIFGGLREIKKWKDRGPRQRQRILHGPSLVVDGRGDINIPSYQVGLSLSTARERGWGQIHWDSYGQLLCELQEHLNSIVSSSSTAQAVVMHEWITVTRWDRKLWASNTDGVTAPLTLEELLHTASFHFPVYAFGYNWLLSNDDSSKRLCAMVQQTIAEWKAKGKICNQVILVTHSMGGLVARACAKQIPKEISGVVHGVMPAVGAPVCYRRLACGTESSSPGKTGFKDEKVAEAFAIIAGETAAETTPVLSTAPGPLELLPNHLYPRPWLFFQAKWAKDPVREVMQLPHASPYDLYRETTSWYRMIDPALADPAGMHGDTIKDELSDAIKRAEIFHTKILDSYYHPHTYVFYGDDKNQPSFGSCRYLSVDLPPAYTGNDIAHGTPNVDTNVYGTRSIWVKNDLLCNFLPLPQDVSGDGTVPAQSGSAPVKKVRQIFATSGYDHQHSYKDASMLALTKHLIAKIVQELA